MLKNVYEGLTARRCIWRLKCLTQSVFIERVFFRNVPDLRVFWALRVYFFRNSAGRSFDRLTNNCNCIHFMMYIMEYWIMYFSNKYSLWLAECCKASFDFTRRLCLSFARKTRDRNLCNFNERILWLILCYSVHTNIVCDRGLLHIISPYFGIFSACVGMKLFCTY